MVLKLAEHICEVLNFLDNAAVFITHHVRHELSVQIILLATAGMLVTPLPLDAPNLLTWPSRKLLHDILCTLSTCGTVKKVLHHTWR